MVERKLAARLVIFSIGLASGPAFSQTAQTMAPAGAQSPVNGNAEQTAQILGLTSGLKQLSGLQDSRSCDDAASLPELSLRQQLSENIQAATLDVDGAIAEINNEQGEISNLRATLQMKRDKTVARYNAAALITGSGAGAAVSATQFTNLGSRTNNIGDGFGIGAGVASTVLSVIATRKQNGPNGTVGQVPNMLAPLFDRKPVLNTYYPPIVLRFLESTPVNEDPTQGTRLDRLKAEWIKSGRLMPQGKAQQSIARLTTSEDPEVKVTIQDLSNRIAMLVDVAGRISLMKRDLAIWMRIIGHSTQCPVSKNETE